jgi:hypothetical protein
MNHAAIYNLYPQVVAIDDVAGAFDAQGNKVIVDMAAIAEEAKRLSFLHEKNSQINKLCKLLADTDYVALSDYDQNKLEIKAQRQAWRDEIRQLKGASE